MDREPLTLEEAEQISKVLRDMGVSRFVFRGLEVEFRHAQALIEKEHEIFVQKTKEELEDAANQALSWSSNG